VDRIAIWIAALGVVASGGAWFFGGWAMGTSALAGAAVAFANWVALRWIGAKLVRATGAKRAGVALLMLKMAALVGISAALLLTGVVQPLGFLIGLGALVVGTAVGGMQESLATAEQEQKEEADAAR
jgi:hypothetical protein